MPIFPVIDFEPVRYGASDRRKSPTIRPLVTAAKRRRYSRQPAAKHIYPASDMTERQANFYTNLVGLALVIGSSRIPVDFEDRQGNRWYLDHGCIKMAAHAGFIRPLQDGSDDVLEEIVLAWRTDGTSALDASSD
jgi:hypothetical protein